MAAPIAATLVERLRQVHLRMVDAVLAGDGLERVAELAADAVGGSVAIVVPRLGTAVVAPAGTPATDRLPELRRYVADLVQDRPANPPRGLAIEIPIGSGDEAIGAVLLLEGAASSNGEAAEYLHLAAVASLTEVAVEEARDEVEQNLRGSFLEDLRSGNGLPPDELVRRGARLGCDLVRGAIALCAELHSDRPRHVVATIAEDIPGALAQHMEGTPAARRAGASTRCCRRSRATTRRRRRWPRPHGSRRACSVTAPSACRRSTPIRRSSRAPSRRRSSCSTC